jgi:hypothetical protein
VSIEPTTHAAGREERVSAKGADEMRKAPLSVGVVLALAGLALSSVPAGAQTELRLVRFANASRYQLIDLGRPGFRLGDRMAVRGPLTDPTTASEVGTENLDCVVMVGFTAPEGGRFRCDTVLHLIDGDLMLDGLLPHGSGEGSLAVLGGTGAYTGMTGSATVR